MKKEEKQKYKIDPEHEGLTIYQLAEIPKYAGIPVLEMLKLLPEQERNSFVDKQLKNIEMSEKFGLFKFIKKALQYDISKGLTVEQANQNSEYKLNEETISFEILADKLQDDILNEVNTNQNLETHIDALNLIISDINPSPLDNRRTLLLYFKERLQGMKLKLETFKAILPIHRSNNQTKKNSYKWQTDPDKELQELYTLMKDKYKLIAPETTTEQFKDSFISDDMENIIPIKWLKSNRLLAYFLDNYFSGQNYQSIAETRKQFSKPNGKLINKNDLSVAKKNYIDYGKPKGYEKLDLILKAIKNH